MLEGNRHNSPIALPHVISNFCAFLNFTFFTWSLGLVRWDACLLKSLPTQILRQGNSHTPHPDSGNQPDGNPLPRPSLGGKRVAKGGWKCPSGKNSVTLPVPSLPCLSSMSFLSLSSFLRSSSYRKPSSLCSKDPYFPTSSSLLSHAICVFLCLGKRRVNAGMFSTK